MNIIDTGLKKTCHALRKAMADLEDHDRSPKEHVMCKNWEVHWPRRSPVPTFPDSFFTVGGELLGGRIVGMQICPRHFLT